MTNRLFRYWFMGWFIIWQYENSEHTLPREFGSHPTDTLNKIRFVHK
jgi:hypothetical protein